MALGPMLVPGPVFVLLQVYLRDIAVLHHSVIRKVTTFKSDTSTLEDYTLSGKIKILLSLQGSLCWEQNDVYIIVLCPKLYSGGGESEKEPCTKQLLETSLAKSGP